MGTDHVDRDHLEVTGKHLAISDQHVAIEDRGDGVTIVVTRAFGPKGHSLVGLSDVTFDGFPAITLELETADGQRSPVHLSPIHGDDRKTVLRDIEPGTKVKLYCPVSKLQLDHIGEVEDRAYGAHYYALYLTERLSEGSMVAISDVWGHYHSRIIDDFELISHWHNHEELGESE